MAIHKFTLTHGLKVGEDALKSCVMRELIAGDIIEAQAESEELKYAVDARGGLVPTLVSSPSMMGIHTLRRQILRVGDLDGPLSLDDMKKLHPDDLYLMQIKAEELDGALTAEEAAKELASRGRPNDAGGVNGEHRADSIEPRPASE